MRGIIYTFALGVVIAVSSTFAYAEKRVALVIGNANYERIAKLKNPRNDAELIARTLRGVGSR